MQLSRKCTDPASAGFLLMAGAWAFPFMALGPHSNADGPNEFLHLDYAKRLTACVADVLAAHAISPESG